MDPTEFVGIFRNAESSSRKTKVSEIVSENPLLIEIPRSEKHDYLSGVRASSAPIRSGEIFYAVRHGNPQYVFAV